MPCWPGGPVMTAVMGGEAHFRETSPQLQMLASFPRTLLIHGDADETVDISMSQHFQEALTVAGVQATFHTYPGRGHSELLFHALTENPGQLITDVTAFANACP